MRNNMEIISLILITLFFTFVGVFILSGCASKPLYKTEVKEVFIPVACNVEIPKRQREGEGIVANYKGLILQAEKLEQLLRYCKGE